MRSLCLYLQIHQPYRVKSSISLQGRGTLQFDDALNEQIMKRVAERCYIPVADTLLEMASLYREDFSCALSLTGTAIEQMELYAPRALERFVRLVDTGIVELLSETYFHSLAALHEKSDEFEIQVRMHQDMTQRIFGCTPTVFRNTELVYNDTIAQRVANLGFNGVLVEGLEGPHCITTSSGVYRARDTKLAVIPRNFRVSDELAFRFTDSKGNTALRLDSYRDALDSLFVNDRRTVMIGVDFETFGEHIDIATGILQFLRDLPRNSPDAPQFQWVTPSQMIERNTVDVEFVSPDTISWADESKDISTWLGNAMQRRAFEALYDGSIQKSVGEDVWRRLQTSDHLYYMSTKRGADGDVHKYFSPFDNPYEAFISFMNSVQSDQSQEQIRVRQAS